ncbi:hypothetical protein PGR6_07050 [Pseudomonas sp. GR 6-02]|nr:hypothetical protein PGR6_07050 [Pseudomonas sp. GR 6-02]
MAFDGGDTGQGADECLDTVDEHMPGVVQLFADIFTDALKWRRS